MSETNRDAAIQQIRQLARDHEIDLEQLDVDTSHGLVLPDEWEPAPDMSPGEALSAFLGEVVELNGGAGIQIPGSVTITVPFDVEVRSFTDQLRRCELVRCTVCHAIEIRPRGVDGCPVLCREHTHIDRARVMDVSVTRDNTEGELSILELSLNYSETHEMFSDRDEMRQIAEIDHIESCHNCESVSIKYSSVSSSECPSCGHTYFDVDLSIMDDKPQLYPRHGGGDE